MPKADYSFSTQDGALQPTPSIYDLGVWLAVAQQNLDELQTAKKGSDNHKASDTFSALKEHLTGMIGSLPAVTLADAAVQLKVAYGLACGMDGINPPERVTEFAQKIERLMVSAVPIVTKAAGIELETLFLQHDFPRMHTIIFKGGADLDQVPA